MTTGDTDIFKSIRNLSGSADDRVYWGGTSGWGWQARPGAIQLADGRWVACGCHQRPRGSAMGGSPNHPFKNKINSKPPEGWLIGGRFYPYYGDSWGGTPKCNDAAIKAWDMSL